MSAFNDAKQFPEYHDEYLFEYKSFLSSNDFNHPGAKELVEACNQLNVNMIPDVVLQSIELEAFERFKKAVTRHIEGKSITYLMGMKNDIERKMMKDQVESLGKKIAEIDSFIESEYPVKEEIKEVVTEVSKLVGKKSK